MKFRKFLLITLSALLIFSSVGGYPVHSFAEKKSLKEDFFSDSSDLLSFLPPIDTHQPMMNPAQGIAPPLPNASPEIPNSQVTPRKQQETPPSDNSTIDLPVNVENGYLELKEVDVLVPQMLQSFGVTRDYSSNNDEVGPFGKGWKTGLDSKLQMYTEFAMGEFRQDSSTQNYEFVKDDPDGYITEYDGDNKTNYELHKGHYKDADNGDKLERISQYEYVVETIDGTKFTYYGYFTPWRQNQSPLIGKMIKKTDRYGNAIQYEYDNAGLLTSMADDSGRTVHINWSGNVISEIINPENQKIRFTYDGESRLKKIDYSGDKSTAYSFDSKGRITGITNGEGETTSFTYDNNNRVTLVKNPAGKTIYTYSYTTDGSGELTKTVKENALGEAWTYHVEKEKVIKVLNPLGDETSFTYNKNGDITKKVSKMGTETFDYDDKDRLITKKDPFGVTTSYAFEEPWNLQKSITDSTGKSIIFEYDAKGNVEKKT